jgi:hypothetical protein
VLRNILEPRREEISVGWRKLHNAELNDLYFSPNIIRMVKSRRIRVRAYSTNGRKEKYIHNFGGKARRKQTTLKWKDNINMNLRDRV